MSIKMLIGIELIKECLTEENYKRIEPFTEFITKMIIHEMYFNIMLLTDDEQELIIRSSEYARIHKGRF